jgi:hypothetical protein
MNRGCIQSLAMAGISVCPYVSAGACSGRFRPTADRQRCGWACRRWRDNATRLHGGLDVSRKRRWADAAEHGIDEVEIAEWLDPQPGESQHCEPYQQQNADRATHVPQGSASPTRIVNQHAGRDSAHAFLNPITSISTRFSQTEGYSVVANSSPNWWVPISDR